MDFTTVTQYLFGGLRSMHSTGAKKLEDGEGGDQTGSAEDKKWLGVYEKLEAKPAEIVVSSWLFNIAGWTGKKKAALATNPMGTLEVGFTNQHGPGEN